MRIEAICAATTSGITYGPAERQAYLAYLTALRARRMQRTEEPRELSALVRTEEVHQKVMLEAAKIDPVNFLSSVLAQRNYLQKR